MSDYSVIVWHSDPVNGRHQHVLLGASTEAKARRAFAKYMERPARCRSFTDQNVVQMHGPRGAMFNINTQEQA